MTANKETEPVIVYYGNILQAGYVKSLLENAEINCFIQDEAMGTMIPWYVSPGGIGSVKVVVAGKDVELAKTIIQEFETSEPQSEEGEDN